MVRRIPSRTQHGSSSSGLLVHGLCEECFCGLSFFASQSRTLVKIRESNTISDPNVKRYPSGSLERKEVPNRPYDIGFEVRLNWPPSRTWSNPIEFNATGIVKDRNDAIPPETLYTVDVMGTMQKMHLDFLTGRFTTDQNMQGGFMPHANFTKDATAVARQVLKDLRDDDALSNAHDQILTLVHGAIEFFMQEDALLEIKVEADEKCAIFGDIHGNFRCLKNLLAHRPQGKSKYLFLGDFVDRGSHQLEVVAYVLAKKILYPNEWFLLRGNHEDLSTNQRYGFAAHCIEILGAKGTDLHRSVNHLFNFLPLAAIVYNGTEPGLFCCHGGIGPDMKCRDDISQLKIQKPCCIRTNGSQPWNRILRDLTWSDVREPEELALCGKCFNQEGWSEGQRGAGTLFWGPTATERFLVAMDCSRIVRAHDPSHAPRGIKFDHGGKVITVFSSTPYVIAEMDDGRYLSNEGAAMLVFLGDSGALDIVTLNQYHERTYSMLASSSDVECTEDGQVMTKSFSGKKTYELPTLSDLAKAASPDTTTSSRSTSAVAKSFIFTPGMHLLVGNISRPGPTPLRQSPDGEDAHIKALQDGEVVMIQSLNEDGLWANVINSEEHAGWLHVWNLHEQIRDISMKDISIVPGLEGSFVFKPGIDVVFGVIHQDGRSQVQQMPLRSAPAGKSIPDQVISDGAHVLIDQVTPDADWVCIKKGALVGWVRTSNLHVQAASHSRDLATVPPFLPLHHRLVVFGSEISDAGSHPLLTRDGSPTGQTIQDGELVQVVHEGALLGTSMVEVQTSGDNQRDGWIPTRQIHVQLREIEGVPILSPGFAKLHEGKQVIVGVTHTKARQSRLLESPTSDTGVAMVLDGEKVEVLSITSDGEWTEVRQLLGAKNSQNSGWIRTQSLHVQV